MSDSKFDLEVDVAIVGAGSAGLSALSEVRKVTDSVVIADDGPLGTTCARVGCMPSKGLIEWPGLPAAEREGTTPFARTRALRDDFVASVVRGMEKDTRFLRRARARFEAPGVLRIGREVVRARHVVVATGSSPIVPPEWSGWGERLLTSDTVFELDEAPRSCAVVGAGPLGLELGQALARLGTRVDLFALDRKIGGLSDPDVAARAIELLGRDFALHVGGPARPAADGAIVAGDVRVAPERVLLSLGRRPNLAGLALENSGVELDDEGRPKFDEATRRAGGTGVFFAGDVAGDRPVLHEAVYQGRVAGFNATRSGPSRFKPYPRLGLVFTHPGLATVGPKCDTFEKRVTGEVDFARQGRARLRGEAGGLLRVYVDPRGGRLLGAEMACPGAEHLAHLLAFALTRASTVFDLLETPYYHPTLEEGLRTALVAAAKQVETEESDEDRARGASSSVVGR